MRRIKKRSDGQKLTDLKGRRGETRRFATSEAKSNIARPQAVKIGCGGNKEHACRPIWQPIFWVLRKSKSGILKSGERGQKRKSLVRLKLPGGTQQKGGGGENLRKEKRYRVKKHFTKKAIRVKMFKNGLQIRSKHAAMVGPLGYERGGKWETCNIRRKRKVESGGSFLRPKKVKGDPRKRWKLGVAGARRGFSDREICTKA